MDGAGLACSLALDGREPVGVTLVPVRLWGRAGLLVRRPPGWHQAVRPGRRPIVHERSLAAVGDAPGLSFVEVHAGELVRTALGLAVVSPVLSVTVCPPGVSPGRSALAVAVADLLRVPDGVPMVTCAVRPPLGDRCSAIPHVVRVTVGDSVQQRIVWQVLGWDHVPAWLASLGRPAVAA